MKKMSTTVLVVLLLVPLFAFAAPKKRLTIPALKKQVAALISENKSLKAELAKLKAQQPLSCPQTPAVASSFRAEEQPTLPEVTRQSEQVTMPIEETPQTPKREVRFNASPITDRVEVNGLETAIGIIFQVSGLIGGDVVNLSGTEITSQEQSSSAVTYRLPLTATNFSVVINGESHSVEVVVSDSPDRGSNSNKHIYVSPRTQSVMI